MPQQAVAWDQAWAMPSVVRKISHHTTEAGASVLRWAVKAEAKEQSLFPADIRKLYIAFVLER